MDSKDQDKKLVIVGLGNPGSEYEGTRHNAGFLFVDFILTKQNKNKIKEKKTKKALVYVIGENLILVKPQTFMNRSGEAVKEVVKWYDVDIEEQLVLAHDDLDIPLGKTKLQFARSPGKHKGVKSVESHLGTTQFKRLRIGVENRQGKEIPGVKYNMQKFSEDELVVLNKAFDESVGKLYLSFHRDKRL
jgi:PTH1 family peptidyl-tRNA hydrolase